MRIDDHAYSISQLFWAFKDLIRPRILEVRISRAHCIRETGWLWKNENKKTQRIFLTNYVLLLLLLLHNYLLLCFFSNQIERKYFFLKKSILKGNFNNYIFSKKVSMECVQLSHINVDLNNFDRKIIILFNVYSSQYYKTLLELKIHDGRIFNIALI